MTRRTYVPQFMVIQGSVSSKSMWLTNMRETGVIPKLVLLGTKDHCVTWCFILSLTVGVLPKVTRDPFCRFIHLHGESRGQTFPVVCDHVGRPVGFLVNIEGLFTGKGDPQKLRSFDGSCEGEVGVGFGFDGKGWSNRSFTCEGPHLLCF